MQIQIRLEFLIFSNIVSTGVTCHCEGAGEPESSHDKV